MPVYIERRIAQELFLFFLGNLRDPKGKKLDIVLYFFAEVINGIKLRLQLRVVLVLGSSQPEIVSFISLASVLPLPQFIFVQCLFQCGGIFEIVAAVFPLIDECIALFLKRFSIFLNGSIVVAAEELSEIPCYLFQIRSFPAYDIFL